MKHVSLPLLLEDGSRLDWLEGRYEPTVSVASDWARIQHSVSGAPSLERAVDEGSAKWAVELRCPKTLLSRTELSSKSEQIVKWNLDDLDDISWIVPGLLASKKFELRAEELSPLWKGATLIVPQGWWLARGTKRKVRNLAQSLLSFVLDDQLDNGQMSVVSHTGSGVTRFEVHLAADIYPDITDNRTLQIAGLIGVCAHLPKVFDEHLEDSVTAREIRNRLEKAKVPTWNEEAYDPAQAATVIEKFYPARNSEDSED